MSNALALIQPTEYDLMAKLAKVAAMSGYSKQNEVQAMFIMLKGFELGISPMQALDGIQVIQGKTTVSPQLMLALINRSGLMEDLQMDGDSKSYTVTMKRVGRSPHTEVFTIENAKSMGLAGKDNWQKQPAVMLKWRAVSACARVVFPDVIQGMYTPEEMGADVSENEAGDIVIEQPPLAVLPPPTVDTSTGEIVEGNVVENAEIPQNSVPQSDLGVSADNSDVKPSDSPEIAKSRFAGNGAPPAGEKKRIGSSDGFTYDRIKLFMEAAKNKTLADINSTERNNTIIAMEGEGAFKDADSYARCIELVIARIQSPEHGKGKKSKAETDVVF